MPSKETATGDSSRTRKYVQGNQIIKCNENNESLASYCQRKKETQKYGKGENWAESPGITVELELPD